MIIFRNFLLTVIVAATTGMATAQGGPKIATVDMQELFKQYFRTHEAQKQIDIERDRITRDNDDRMVRIRELETSLTNLRKQLDDPALADSVKQARFRDLQAQQQEAVQLDRERREFIQRRQQALNEKMVQRMRGILEEIRTLVETQARKDDYDFVMDKSGLSTSQVPIILYTKDASDITRVILKDLNKDAPEDFVPLDTDLTPPTGQ